MSPIKQYLPYAITDEVQFKKDKKNLLQRLNKLIHPSNAFSEYDFNPYPLLLNPSLMAQITDAHRLITKATTHIVMDFFNNPALQNIISLPDPVISLLERSRNKPFQLGAIRPDFLFDSDYNIKICEINARFPSNLFIFTEYLYAAMVSAYTHAPLNLSNRSIDCTAAMQAFFDQEKVIHILLEKEKSTEIYLLKNRLSAKALLSEKSSLKREIGQYEQFILNLHQEELANLSPQLLNKITEHRYYNDLRTIFIVHDKRLLAVLNDTAILSRYLGNEEVNRLQKYIIPTYLVNKEIKQTLCDNQDAWVLKKFASGKGEGMFIGKETQPTLFRKLLHSLPIDYIAQPFIQQPPFNLIHDSKEPLYLVGSLLSFNNQLLGPGLFRASHKSIINALGGGASFFTGLY